ncbi:MAG: CheR family methyltransferase [Terriglobales bacterium]
MTTSEVPLRAVEAPLRPPTPQLIQIRELVYQVAGIFQPDNKLCQLEDRCRERMRALGVTTLSEYYECLTLKPIRQAELVSLLNEITIGETCFFRNRPQLDALRNVVLTRIVEGRKKMALRHLRIWSAGCSTGEEPYTLSLMLLEELAGRLQGWTFEVVATDLNEHSVAHARAGLYGNYSTRHLTPQIAQKYFSPAGENLQVNVEVKTHVSIARVNLLDDARMVFLRGFDIIMCCNVLIYFDLLSKRRVIQHFYNNLLPHGYLFLGHSESLYGVNDDFRLVHLPSATAYVRSEERQPEERQVAREVEHE